MVERQRRLKAIVVPEGILLSAVCEPKRGKPIFRMDFGDALPIDCDIMNAFSSPMRPGVTFIIYHKSFPLVPNGEEIPILEYEFISHQPIGEDRGSSNSD